MNFVLISGSFNNLFLIIGAKNQYNVFGNNSDEEMKETSVQRCENFSQHNEFIKFQ